MINCLILSKRKFLKRKKLSGEKVVSVTKEKYGLTVHFLSLFIKYLELISNELLIARFFEALIFLKLSQ